MMYLAQYLIYESEPCMIFGGYRTTLRREEKIFEALNNENAIRQTEMIGKEIQMLYETSSVSLERLLIIEPVKLEISN